MGSHENRKPHPEIAITAASGWGFFLAVLSFIALFGAAPTMDAQQVPASPTVQSTPLGGEPKPTTPPVVSPGILIKRVPPKYPKQARKQHLEGAVVLRATITKEEEISDLRLVSGEPMPAEAALEAVKKWKYRPYQKDGQAVAVDTEITVNFALSH